MGAPREGGGRAGQGLPPGPSSAPDRNWTERQPGLHPKRRSRPRGGLHACTFWALAPHVGHFLEQVTPPVATSCEPACTLTDWPSLKRGHAWLPAKESSPDGHGQCSASKRVTRSVVWDLAGGTGRERDRKSHLGQVCRCPRGETALLRDPGLPPALTPPAPEAGWGRAAAGKKGKRPSPETHRLDEGQLLLKGHDAQPFPQKR